MEIEIREPNNQQLLTKTQKQKIRKLVKDLWKDEIEFYDQIDTILESIHYSTTHEHLKYNHIEHNLIDERHLSLAFKKIHIESPEERREKLRKKLHEKIQAKKHAVANADPQEQMYQRLTQSLPEAQRRILPKPSQVRSNVEMYKQMMTMLPNDNPLYKYLATFMD